jgi:hypothetical protein
MDYLMVTHNEIYEVYQNYGRLVHEKGDRWRKTRWLIKAAINGW